MKFSIPANASLSFADAVGGGTVIFTANSGSGVLDVGALSSFDPTGIKNLSIGTGENTEASVLDFINVGTAATATLTNTTTAGATLTVFADTGSHAIPMIGNFTTVMGSATKFVNVNYVSDGRGGTNIFLTDTPCYAAGTAILTQAGEVPVEMIRAGDVVMTYENARLVPRCVIWAAMREIDLTAHPRPNAVAPIRFRSHAFSANLPRRDLLVSPDHCLFLDGGLVAARPLINGMIVVRDILAARVTYHHLELDRHTLLVAEGVAAESYLDTGNRAYFSKAGQALIEHPEFTINEHLKCWESDACAPLLSARNSCGLSGRSLPPEPPRCASACLTRRRPRIQTRG